MRKTPLSGQGPLREKSFNLAIRIINLSKFLKNDKKEFLISKQIFRSGTNPGAMVREAKHAESPMDFIHKLSVAQKESQETLYWLELLYETEYINEDEFQSLHHDTTEIIKLITASILTKKRNLKK